MRRIVRSDADPTNDYTYWSIGGCGCCSEYIGFDFTEFAPNGCINIDDLKSIIKDLKELIQLAENDIKYLKARK